MSLSRALFYCCCGGGVSDQIADHALRVRRANKQHSPCSELHIQMGKNRTRPAASSSNEPAQPEVGTESGLFAAGPH